jgi:succinate dehydrogenase hydrophobic anchor subunit
METVFLVFVVVHALLGLRSILLDLHPAPTLMRWINWVLIFLGVAAIGYGVWLALFIAAKGAGA